MALLLLLLGPKVVLAQGYFESIGLTGLTLPFERPDLMGVIGIIINLAFALAGLIATVYIIMGGYTYITAGGNPEALEGAKAQITNSIIGLVIILISYLIVGFVLTQLNVTTEPLRDVPTQADHEASTEEESGGTPPATGDLSTSP